MAPRTRSSAGSGHNGERDIAPTPEWLPGQGALQALDTTVNETLSPPLRMSWSLGRGRGRGEVGSMIRGSQVALV